MNFDNEFLDLYLRYVEDTESPRVFHIWSAIAGIGACLGRRAYLPFGNGQLFANNYILLVGPPGVRKSTAINTTQKLLRRSGRIRFAPSDTGGARQGLINAMRGDDPDELVKRKKGTDEEKIIKDILNTIDNVENLDKLNNIQMNVADAHTMFVCASELATFIGMNSYDMITFLIKMWDGEDYDYRIKNEFTTITNPLLSILGGTTPSSIATSLPPTAVGGGFMSRLLLVFANKKHKHIAFPATPDGAIETELAERYTAICDNCNGAFELAPVARKMLEQLYKYDVEINDPRFVYYMERRFSHLLKTCMAFAAMSNRMGITELDVELAQLCLVEAEKNMVDALGEYGLSPISAAKQKLLEFIEFSAPAPVPINTITAMMKRDMKSVDIFNSLSDLCNAGKIKRLTTNYGEAYIYMGKNDAVKEFIESSVMEELSDGTRH